MDIPENWTFKTPEVAKNFDQHVREQLAWYDILTDLVAIIVRHYLPTNGRAYDIGASTGNLASILEQDVIAKHAEYICIDNAKEMRDCFRSKLPLKIHDAISYPYKNFDVGILFLVLMFLPVDKRLNFVKDLYSKLNQGGVIIIIDKIELGSDNLAQAIYRFVLEQKQKHGATPENILKKEFSLAGIQRPLNKDFFVESPHVTNIFQFGNFCGWALTKPEHHLAI